ncbi:metallophosphoesterase family protein [Luteimonas sp. RD2P54]|uniref:Phosphoesterase n=1 Tax=Luteimonas endophytica TaxID=3042023 RepID=A0ABT6J8N4_9GAMM|nr:metallophosphoesterase family protein [Luteimonas endophytica]MDH5822563.1 metallophosphoesterase family protein [Luteimonas endophytica]
MRIGLISDTHGLLRPEALAFLQGCDHIVHAGDIGTPDILAALAALAPLSAIRGNVDTGDWAAAVPDTLELALGGLRLLVLHDRKQLQRDPGAEGFDVVVSGHSHRPRIEARGDVLYVNPGSAGRRRFSLPVTAAELVVAHGKLTPRIVELM